jgi:outer membrane protein assembly factor BamC
VSRAGLAIALLFVLGACGWLSDDKGIFVDKSDDYVTAHLDRPLVVPDDLDRKGLEDPFPIPPTPAVAKAEYFPGRPPLPDAIYASDNREEVRIQRIGERRWLVVPEPPTTVWPKIKQFLAENGAYVALEISQRGRLDSEWITVGDEARRDVLGLILQEAHQAAGVQSGRDRVLVQLEQGLREQSSEVHVRHENDSMKRPIPDDTLDIEPVVSDLPLAEQEVLRELGAYIAAKVSEQTVSLVGGEIAGQPKTELGRTGSGDPALFLFLDEERAWATLGQALSNANVEVTAVDRDRGYYYVTMHESTFTGDEERGWLSSLFAGRDRAYPLIIALALDSEGRRAVTVLEADSAGADAELCQQVLVLLREYAS